jgi:AcrR family transcriptional regulator
MSVQLEPEVRRNLMVDAGVGLAMRIGLANVTIETVATECRVGRMTVYRIIGDKRKLHRLIARRARRTDNAVVIAQAVAMGL